MHGARIPVQVLAIFLISLPGSGWGNVLQEMVLNTHLAYLSGRAFVFDNYTWDRSPSEYSTFNGKKIPSRVPVSTMLAGNYKDLTKLLSIQSTISIV